MNVYVLLSQKYDVFFHVVWKGCLFKQNNRGFISAFTMNVDVINYHVMLSYSNADKLNYQRFVWLELRFTVSAFQWVILLSRVLHSTFCEFTRLVRYLSCLNTKVRWLLAKFLCQTPVTLPKHQISLVFHLCTTITCARLSLGVQSWYNHRFRSGIQTCTQAI